MVNKSPHPGEINDLSGIHTTAQGRFRHNRRVVDVGFPTGLYEQIKAEANLRQWSFAHMVRHLCEASIGGIE